MKERTFALLILISTFAAACQKDDPGDNGNGTGKVIAEKVVDAGGATLTGGDITVVFPANAITTAATISISKSSDKPFGTSQISETYFINNLPETLYGPITVTLGGASAANDVKTFIGEEGYAPSLGTDTLSYRMIPHNTVNGALQVVIEPVSGLKAGKAAESGSGGWSMGILAAGGQGTYLTPEGHFRITYPVSDEPGAQELGPYLEEAWLKYSAAPFSFSYANRTQWPVEVTVRPLGSTIFGYCGASIWGNNSNYLQFNFDKLSDHAAMRVTAGHEFLHFVQYLYDPRNRVSKKSSEPESLWIDEAQAVWAESLFSSTVNYLSAVRNGNEKAPFSGVRKAKADGAQDYGYGMSSVIKFLTIQHGNAIIRIINEKILAGQNPAEAIRLATGKSYYEWFGNFIDQFTQGKIYNDLPVATLVNGKTDEFIISASKDSVKEFTSGYGQLQSKIYITTLTADAFTENSSLDILIKDPTNSEMLNVYKFTSNSMERIGQSLVSVNVPDIKNLAQAGYKLLTVVTNQNYSYLNDAGQNITMVNRIVERKNFKKFSFDLTVMCNYKTTYSSGSTDTGTNSYSLYIQDVPCTQKGNVVTAAWNGTFGGVPSKGDATFTLEPDSTITFSINLEETFTSSVHTSSATGKGVYFKSDSFYARQFYAPQSYLVLQTASFKEVYSGFTKVSTGILQDPQYTFKDLMIMLMY